MAFAAGALGFVLTVAFGPGVGLGYLLGLIVTLIYVTIRMG